MNASSTAPRSRTRGFIIAIALCAGAGVGFQLLSDALDHAERGEAAVRWTRDAVATRQRYLADPDAYAQDVGAVRKDLAQLEQRLPAQFADAEVDAGLQALAERHGLALNRIERGNERMRDFYASRELHFELRGTAVALQAFFRDYADVVPIQRVGHIRVTPADNAAGMLVADVQAEEYRYIENAASR
ncbi:MAG: hypothetical protein AMXMBFR59_05140 [Rhodanobacteraceae bacterium]